MSLQSFFTLMILVLEIPCGAIADYISRKVSLILGALSTALAALVYGSFSNIFVFMIGETLFALGNSLISGTGQAFLYDTLKKMGRSDQISKYVARNRSFGLFGITLSAPLGSLIGSILSLNLVMTLMFIPFSIAVIISFSFKEPSQVQEDIKTQNYSCQEVYIHLNMNLVLLFFLIFQYFHQIRLLSLYSGNNDFQYRFYLIKSHLIFHQIIHFDS